MEQLQIGKTYSVTRPGFKDSFKGEDFEFPAETFAIQPQPKPETVVADDGVTQEVVPLPNHLAQPDWYLVENKTKGIRHWFCPSADLEIKEIKITEIEA